MSIPFVTFKPAQYHKGKDCYIDYYVVNPMTNKMSRRKIRVNHISKPSERDRFARTVCHAINERLYSGWNPFMDELSVKGVTIASAINKFLEAKARDSRDRTMSSYRSYCKALSEWLSETGNSGKYCMLISRDMFLNFLSWLPDHRKCSNKTFNNYCNFYRTLFEYFVSHGWMQENPASDLPKKRVDTKTRTVIPKDARARIMEYFTQHTPNFRYVMLMCFRLFIRPNEISLLRIRDINMRESLIRIPPDVSKNHKERILAVPDEIMEHFRSIESYPSEYFIFSDSQTYRPGRKHQASTRIAETWAEMRSALGLPTEYQFYSLKDTGITEMLESGVPPKYVKELAGHHSLEMTEKYTHRSDAKKILEWNTLEF